MPATASGPRRPEEVLSPRALARATLERQLLLRRQSMSVFDALTHLVGMQAQVPLNPYVGLWSRLDGFRPEELSRLLIERQVVRIVVMRGTIHLVTAEDCLVLRPLAQPVLDRELARHRDYGPALQGVDLEPVLAFARPLLADRPLTQRELRAAMHERFPDLDPGALAYACRNLLAFIQVPPRGVWGQPAQVRSTTAEAWLGRSVATDPSVDDVMLRYLGAFGPATVADASAWSRLTGLREVFERLRPRLRTFKDERGRELFDLPDAPRPDPDTPAPPRFLPEYDNVLLSHHDRTRFVSDESRRRLLDATQLGRGSLLYDGRVFGTWWNERDREHGRVTLVINHVERLTKRASSALSAEGCRLLRFLEPRLEEGDVRFVPQDGEA